jgi:hypothetical protein
MRSLAFPTKPEEQECGDQASEQAGGENLNIVTCRVTLGKRATDTRPRNCTQCSGKHSPRPGSSHVAEHSENERTARDNFHPSTEAIVAEDHRSQDACDRSLQAKESA